MPHINQSSNIKQHQASNQYTMAAAIRGGHHQDVVHVQLDWQLNLRDERWLDTRHPSQTRVAKVLARAVALGTREATVEVGQALERRQRQGLERIIGRCTGHTD
mgnify:CR=1 FL=1